MRQDEQRAELERVERCRELISVWVGLFKAVQLYEWGHNAALSLGKRIASLNGAIADCGDLELVVRDDSIFVDGVRIREKSVGSASYQQLVALFRAVGVRTLRADPEAEPGEFEALARTLMRAADGDLAPEELVRELGVQGASNLEIERVEDEEEDPDEVTPREVQRRIYLRSIGVLKGVFHELRTRDRINARRVKRVVQEMIEKLELDPGYMLNLTNVKNYDEYTFNHSVNVSVLAIALGRAIGLTRRQLYVVGQAGMLHDIGKLCVPKHILNKPGRHTPPERALMRAHPVEGFLSIATRQGVAADTIAVALGAYEHHLNVDGTGYPERARARPIGLLSRVVSIVDRYDAMTSSRIYRSEPIPPPKALALMYGSGPTRVDGVLLTYFMNMLGAYPLGTLVRLSDQSVGIVVGTEDDERLQHLPQVRLVLDADGAPAPDICRYLAEDAKNPDGLRIVETLNPTDYGIDVGDFLL